MTLLHESRQTLRLAVPLMIGQVSQMLLGVVDTVMIGHLGVADLAALTFANALFHVPFIFGIGLLTAVPVFTANSRGSGDVEGVRASCRDGLALALGLGALFFGIAWVVSANLGFFGQPEIVVARTPVYFRILMASLIPALASIALKNHADALHRPWPPFWIFLGGVGLNIFLNWIMIYGNWGCPALGFEGAAWATLISRIAILAALAAWLACDESLHEWMPRRWFGALHFSGLKRLLSVGFPASLQMLSEICAYSLAGLIMGRFGPDAMAAHQIAITLAGTAYMVPLGLSMALTVRIGQANGAREFHRLRPIAISGWLLGGLYSLFAAALFLVFGKPLAGFFVTTPSVITLTATLLVAVGFSQFVDSLQVTSGAMLRGLNDVRVPALLGFAGYWLVGLPVAALLGFTFGFGAAGVWWGLSAGLAMAWITLGPRLWRRTGRGISFP